MNQSILQTNADRYYGKTIKRIEDNYGNELSDLVMTEDIVIVFTDGEKLTLSTDFRGAECYISQRTNKE